MLNQDNNILFFMFIFVKDHKPGPPAAPICNNNIPISNIFSSLQSSIANQLTESIKISRLNSYASSEQKATSRCLCSYSAKTIFLLICLIGWFLFQKKSKFQLYMFNIFQVYLILEKINFQVYMFSKYLKAIREFNLI